MQLSIRIDLTDGRIGPGKIAMLEAIREVGSISGAARKIKLSYRKAWLIVDDVNKVLGQPVVTTEIGGNNRGGAVLTPVGEQVIAVYHAIESKARSAVGVEFKALKKFVRDD
jgi:molybdate transport system regulatory protein